MHQAVIELDKSRLEAEVEGGGIVLVDCWAEWCAACRDFAPVFERVAASFPEHKFGKLNTQQESEVSELLGIEHIPTLILFRDGIMLFRQPGYFEENKLADIVRQAEAVDMDEVRAHMEAEAKAEAGSDSDKTN